MKKVLLFILLTFILSSVQATEDFVITPATKYHLQMIQEGGYVLFIRHGPTDASRPDHVPIDLNDCNTQRPLTDEGRELMAGIAEAIKQANFPLGSIHSSPLCRAIETTEILFGSDSYLVERYLMYVAALTSAEKVPIIAKTHELLSGSVPLNENRIMVAHGPNLVEVMDYFPVEGTLVIFRPDAANNRFEYIASIEPGHWAYLLSDVE